MDGLNFDNLDYSYIQNNNDTMSSVLVSPASDSSQSNGQPDTSQLQTWTICNNSLSRQPVADKRPSTGSTTSLPSGSNVIWRFPNPSSSNVKFVFSDGKGTNQAIGFSSGGTQHNFGSSRSVYLTPKDIAGASKQIRLSTDTIIRPTAAGAPCFGVVRAIAPTTKLSITHGGMATMVPSFPSNSGTSQKLKPPSNLLLSVLPKTVTPESAMTWETTSTGAATPMSPSKIVIQIASNPLSMMGGSLQQRSMTPQIGRSASFSTHHPGPTNSIQAAPYARLIAAAPSSQQSKTSATAKLSTVGGMGSKSRSLSAINSNQSTKGQTSTTQRLILPLPAASQVQRNVVVANTPLFQAIPNSTGQAVAYLAQAVNPQGYTLLQTPSVLQASNNHLSKSIDSSSSAGLMMKGPQLNFPNEGSANRTNPVRQLQWASPDVPGLPGLQKKKPCNCTKSQCLKLYCECFTNGEFCQDCNCTNCSNNLEHEEERNRAVKSCIDRNPTAFHPKIGKGGNLRHHSKGCNCKRSGCLKNYCECYEAKILCTSLCRCNGCRNFEESSDRQKLMQLAEAAEVRVQQQTAAESKLSLQILGTPVRPPHVSSSGERAPYTFVTLDVIEAMASCLIAKAENTEQQPWKVTQEAHESIILEEFGRCLEQVIVMAARTRPASP